MPLLDRQMQYRELGRLRMGHRVATGKGNTTRPAKLEKWRMTSSSKRLLESAAALYGGEVREWKDAPTDGENWELFTETDRLPIEIPPGDVLEQFYELWSGGGCQRRCDGLRQLKIDKECICPRDLEERAEKAKKGEACVPFTRFRIFLPEIEDVGTWRVETKGGIAADEIPGTYSLLRQAAAAGELIPAFIRLEQRSSKGDGQKKNYVVPVLEVDEKLHEIAAAILGPRGAALGSAPIERRSLPGGAPDPTPTHIEQPQLSPPPVAASAPVIEDAPLPQWILDLPQDLDDGQIVDEVNALLREQGKTATVSSLREIGEKATGEWQAQIIARVNALVTQ